MRAQGKTEVKINGQLRILTFPKIEEPDALTVPPASQNTPDAPGTILAPITAPDDLQTRVTILERSTIEAKQNQREYIQGVAVGFIRAALFFLILVVLISIYYH